MPINTDVIGLVAAVFLASAVEVVEAFTIVLAMGIVRGWRSAIAGTLAALATLAIVTTLAGLALRDYVNAALLQLVVGTLLLSFGLQWLRKAMLRSSGLKALHDEEAIFARELAAARAAGTPHGNGFDAFGFVVSFKGVLLEGVEVVFIVITFGIGAAHRGVPDAMWLAASGALAAAVLVLAAGLVLHRPLAMVPENTMKYGVGLLLTTFGLFWAVEGLGYFGAAGTSIEWPGGNWALLGLLLLGAAVSGLTVRALKHLDAAPAAGDLETGDLRS